MVKLTIDNVARADHEDLKRLHSQYGDFPLPDVDNKLYFCNRIIRDESGKVLGFGLVRLTSEAILIIDQNLPKVTRTRAIIRLVNDMKSITSLMGMDETHAFVSVHYPMLRRLLVRAFRFVECRVKPLYLQF